MVPVAEARRDLRAAHGRRATATLAALFVAALALRPQIVGVGPLIPSIQDDFNSSHAVVGLLGTIPVLCMGLFAPLAAYLAARIGTRQAMTVGLALISSFGIIRALGPSAWAVVLLTLPVGIGMGIGNAIAPLAVKERFASRPATGTGVYTTGIQCGSAASAALAVPLAGVLGGWRGALIALSVCAVGSLVAWVVLMRGEEPHNRPVSASLPRMPWTNRTAWLLVAIFALMGATYYGLNAWLPDAYIEHGWSDRKAGLLLAVMNMAAIASSFILPWLSDRHGRRRSWLLTVNVFFLAGTVGLVAVPAFGFLWSTVAGVAQGGMFALVMTVPLDLEDQPERLGALVALMLGGGYTLAAIAPFAFGAIRDATQSFDAVLWVAAGLLVVQFFALLLLPRSRRDMQR